MQHDEWLIKENITQLRNLMSDQNLQLLPDYEQRISVLKDLEFIDSEARVQLKGKVAAEVHSADELVLTELYVHSSMPKVDVNRICSTLTVCQNTGKCLCRFGARGSSGAPLCLCLSREDR
jgi:antiviral helicase SKI2